MRYMAMGWGNAINKSISVLQGIGMKDTSVVDPYLKKERNKAYFTRGTTFWPTILTAWKHALEVALDSLSWSIIMAWRLSILTFQFRNP